MDQPPQQSVVKKERHKYHEADPDKHFAGWENTVPHQLWSALGVMRHEFTNKQKTETARASAIAKGLPEKDVKRIFIKYIAWATTTPPQFNHQQGDIFPLRDGSHIQTIHITSPTQIECHHIPAGATHASRKAYILEPHQIADWLKTGNAPDQTRQITPCQSNSATFKYFIEP